MLREKIEYNVMAQAIFVSGHGSFNRSFQKRFRKNFDADLWRFQPEIAKAEY